MHRYDEDGYLIVGERDCCERFEPEENGLLCLRECWHCKWADFHKDVTDTTVKESICRYERNRKGEAWKNYHSGYYVSDELADDSGSSNENDVVLRRVINALSENETENGAYRVDTGSFQDIFRFVSRVIERTGINAQLILLNLEHNKVKEEIKEECASKLAEVISGSLRRGDVSNHLSESQFAILLMGSDTGNGEKVAERIVSEFKKVVPNMHEISLTYSIENVGA